MVKLPGSYVPAYFARAAAHIHGRRMMQESVEDRCSDDLVAEDRTPFAIGLVGSENDTASFIAGLSLTDRPQAGVTTTRDTRILLLL